MVLTRLKLLIKTDYALCFAIALGWQILLGAIGWLVGGGNPLAHTIVWDGGWYMTVTHDWYHTNAPSAAFYPLLPLLVSALHIVSLRIISIVLAGFIVNTLAVWLGIVALTKIASYFVAKQYRYLPVLLIFSAAAAFFMHLFYTEAIFFCISAWAYLFALQRKWWSMGLLLSVLTACRLPAILIVILCALEYLRSYSWSIKKSLSKEAYALLLAPLGFITYGAYLFKTTGNFFAMFSAYHASNDWTYQVFNLDVLATIARAIYQPLRTLVGLRSFDHDLIVNDIIPLLALIVLAVTSVYAIVKFKNRFLPLGITGLLSIVMFTINSNIVSAHRYILPCLVVYLVGAYLFEKYRKTRPYIIAGACFSLIIQAFLYASLLHGQFAG